MTSQRQELEIIQNTVNAVVARVRGRAFPGMLLQGDTLHSLYQSACRIVARGSVEGREDDDAEFIRDTLEGMLVVYEKVLQEHGLRLPYEGGVKQDQREEPSG